MSVEVMQWLRGEIEKDVAEGKKLTLDFVTRLNEEVQRLEAWVHDAKSNSTSAVKVLSEPVPYDSGLTGSVTSTMQLPHAAVPHTDIPTSGVDDATANAAVAAKIIAAGPQGTGTYQKAGDDSSEVKTGAEAQAATAAAVGDEAPVVEPPEPLSPEAEEVADTDANLADMKSNVTKPVA